MEKSSRKIIDRTTTPPTQLSEYIVCVEGERHHCVCNKNGIHIFNWKCQYVCVLNRGLKEICTNKTKRNKEEAKEGKKWKRKPNSCEGKSYWHRENRDMLLLFICLVWSRDMSINRALSALELASKPRLCVWRIWMWAVIAVGHSIHDSEWERAWAM